jgi:hypothetical protein
MNVLKEVADPRLFSVTGHHIGFAACAKHAGECKQEGMQVEPILPGQEFGARCAVCAEETRRRSSGKMKVHVESKLIKGTLKLLLSEELAGFGDLALNDATRDLPKTLRLVRMVCGSVPEKHAQQAHVALQAFETLASKLTHDKQVKDAPFVDDSDVHSLEPVDD